MKTRAIYLLLCILGAVLPYWPFVPWVAAHGLNMPLFFQELFANRVSAFFGMDVVVSAAVLLVLIATESRRLGVRRRWLPILALLTVGVSLALPMFLYMRETALEQRDGLRATA